MRRFMAVGLTRGIVPALVGVLVACSGSEPSKTAANIAIADGDQQNAQVSTEVAVRPSVLVTDEAGHPVSGVRVRFTVASGGGVVTGATPLSNAEGIATVGGWTLGTVAGAN